MAYTATDLANIESAISDLVSGKRVVSREVAGKTTTFQAVNLDKLLVLKSQMEAELGTVTLRTYAKQGGRGA